jgi:hypothetical protein
VLSDLIFIDVGSTVIKSAIRRNDRWIEGTFTPRKTDVRIADQVAEILNSTGLKGEIRICSSANGGLRVGLICLTSRYSGAATAHNLQTVGANIVFIREITDEPAENSEIAVDVLVIVGGVEGYPADVFAKHLVKLDLSKFPHDKLVFAGSGLCIDIARNMWPDVQLMQNPLQGGMSVGSDKLAHFVRDTYLEDIESKRELLPLTPLSTTRIEPTPAVVSRAYKHLSLSGQELDLLIDVGGATTDVHFNRELLDDKADASVLTTYGDIGRHVFTGYGVFESKSSTLAALMADERCSDFLGAFDEKRQREVYVDLLENVFPEDLLFYACIFLALTRLKYSRSTASQQAGGNAAPPLNLQRVTSIGITGGAAKVVQTDKLNKVISAVTDRSHLAVVDRNYRWWSIGMMKPDEIVTTNWEN